MGIVQVIDPKIHAGSMVMVCEDKWLQVIFVDGATVYCANTTPLQTIVSYNAMDIENVIESTPAPTLYHVFVPVDYDFGRSSGELSVFVLAYNEDNICKDAYEYALFVTEEDSGTEVEPDLSYYEYGTVDKIADAYVRSDKHHVLIQCYVCGRDRCECQSF
jgi:hypothetical protein